MSDKSDAELAKAAIGESVRKRREAFVMAAMQGLCADSGWKQPNNHIAHVAVQIADATLAAMEQADG